MTLMRLCLTLFVIYLIHPIGLSAQQGQYILSSGSKGGNYFKVGEQVAEQLNKTVPNSNFTNIFSSGSIENLQNLKTQFSDFAIVQRNILLQTIYQETDGVKNIEIVTPLFEEKLLIYHRNGLGNCSISELKGLINNGLVKTFGFTSKESYSFIIFQQIIKILNIPVDKIEYKFEDYDTLIEDFLEDRIDLLISFSLELEELEKESRDNLFYLTEREVQLLTQRITNTSVVLIGTNEYSIGTSTLLIGLSSRIDEIEKKYKIGLSQQLIEGFEKDSSYIGRKIRNTIESFRTSEQQNFLNGMPISSSLKKALDYQNEYSKRVIFLLIGLVLLLLYAFYMLKGFISIKQVKIWWFRYNHFLYGFSLLALLYTLCVEVMVWSERDLYDTLKLKSSILNMEKSDLHLWVFVSNMSNNTNGIFPISTTGKLMFSVSFYTTFIGGLCIYVFEKAKAITKQKRRKGMLQLNFKNHIVINGWNNNTPKFIIDFFENVKTYTKTNQKIVCIVENPQKILEGNKGVSDLNDLGLLFLVEGDAKNEISLIKSNISQANNVVLFAEGVDDSADEKTLLRALAISRFCRQKVIDGESIQNIDHSESETYAVKEYIDSIYIIAEVNNEKYKTNLYSADVNEIVCSSNYASSIISQSVLNHGISTVLEEVLTYNSDNEFYTIDLSLNRNSFLRGRNFDELLILLRKVNIQLVAIRVVYKNENYKEIIDKKEISRLTKEEGLESDILVNPSSETEKNRPVDNDDVLIVFSRSEKELISDLKSLSKMT